MGIAAGSLDGDAGVGLAVHIYVDEAGPYYEIAESGVPKMDGRTWRETGWDDLGWTDSDFDPHSRG